jgi:hypothetical protein
MTKSVCTLLSLFFVTSSFAQANMSPNILGAPFQGERFATKASNDVQGSPLLFENWKSGTVSLVNGEVYNVQKLNFDASTSTFIYSIRDTIYEIQNNVNQVEINGENSDAAGSTTAMLFRNDLLPGQSNFVQVLTKGKITVLRQFSKKPEGENYSNGVVTETRKYVLHSQDVAMVKNKITPLTYSSSALKELTSDKITDVDSYVKSHRLKPKKADDFLEVINYYNTLP